MVYISHLEEALLKPMKDALDLAEALVRLTTDQDSQEH